MRRSHAYPRGELIVVIGCSDLDSSAEFWASVLGYVREDVEEGNCGRITGPVMLPAASSAI
jgi:hypothetical protein